MNTNQLHIFKTLLFIAGLAIIGVAFAIVHYPFPQNGLSDAQKFFWVEVVLCYLIFFVPFFFSSITIDTVDIKITATVHIWISVLIFEAVAITLALLVLHGVVKIRIAILVELILLFLLAIFVYFGYFAGNHIATVQQTEQKSLSRISELKTAFELLSIKIDSWGSEFDVQKLRAKKLCDDVRYMSPVDTSTAFSLENKLIVAANVLAETSISPAEVTLKIDELTSLVKQRQLLRK